MSRQRITSFNMDYQGRGPNYQIDMSIDLDRFERQYNRAQFGLDSMIMTHMQPYMPMVTGTFINVTKAMSAAIAGTGKVVAAAPPMGRFLYEGMVMVDEETGSPWARPGARKVVTEQPLDYSKHKHPHATDHWFEAAKARYGDEWIRYVRRVAGGG